MAIVQYLTDRGWSIEDGDFEQGYLEAVRDSTYLLFTFTSFVARLAFAACTINAEQEVHIDPSFWESKLICYTPDRLDFVFHALYQDAINQEEVHYVPV